MKYLRNIILCLVLPICCFAQTQVPTRIPATRQAGTTLPAVCVTGDEFVKTDAAVGQKAYLCIAANTWEQQTGAAGGSHAATHSENQSDEIFVENLGTACTQNQIPKADATGGLVCGADNDSGGAPAFSGITSGTNTTATMTVGSGGILRSAAGILGVPNSITLPGTCTVGDVYFDNDAGIGLRFNLCTALNTWTAFDNPFGTAIDASEVAADVATQAEIDLKANLASPTFTGTVTVPTPFTLGAVSVTATGTELNFVAGVSSAIQTQLDGKEPSGTYSGIGACAANTWASTLNDTAAPTCTQPDFSNLAGTVGDAQITAAAVDGGSGGEIADGTVDSNDLATANKTIAKTINIFEPVVGDSNMVQIYWPAAVTLQRVACAIDTGTSVTIQFDERAEATPNTAGVNSLTSALVCDTDSQVTTSFSDAGIAADVPHNLAITGVVGTPGVVRIHLKALVN